MKLWVETDSVHSAGRSVRAKVSEAAAGISRQAASRGVRAVNALRNAELNVLKGQRSGKRYRKYPYKSIYTASAPKTTAVFSTSKLLAGINNSGFFILYSSSAISSFVPLIRKNFQHYGTVGILPF